MGGVGFADSFVKAGEINRNLIRILCTILHETFDSRNSVHHGLGEDWKEHRAIRCLIMTGLMMDVLVSFGLFSIVQLTGTQLRPRNQKTTNLVNMRWWG